MTDLEKQELFNLIKQAQIGSQIAYTKLYNKFKPVIFNNILYIVKNRDAAEDITSTTFMKAFNRLDSYKENISFEMWLKTIAINSSIDYIRKTKKERENLFIDDEESTIQLSDTADYSPEDILIGNETDNAIKEALAHLKWKYRNVIELRIVRHMSYKDIANELGLTENQVRALLNKAREKLKKLLT